MSKAPQPLPPYRVIRSSRRSIGLEVRPGGEILLRLPLGASLRQGEHFMREKQAWLMQKLAAARPPQPEPTPQQVAALTRRALEVLPARLDYWTRQLGVVCQGLRITSARKRYGSCSAKGRICFSYRLMLHHPDAIDYVVLHEAAHLKHLNHGPAFHDCLRRHMPDYRRREALLRQGPLTAIDPTDA